ncbi:MAG: LptA/OstA family protein [Gemmataceae bacterium]
MWTPRRLVLLLVGIAGCTALYFGYYQILGRIDGLPPLPTAYFERRTADDADFPTPSRNQIIDVKLQRAFGPQCEELRYNHRLELQKNGVILAMNQVTFEDGRCKLKPFSIAVVKERGLGVDPEVYTVHSDEAYLLFDQPVKNLAEMGKRKIVGCDLVSDPTLLSPDIRRHRVTCNHNRGTTDPNDDLILETTGPVAYRELPSPEPPPDKASPQIRTAAAVRLTDKRGQPHGTTVTAQGMDIYLMSAPSQPPPKTAVAKGKQVPKTGSVSGVSKVVLPADVTMNLWIDPKGGFLAAGQAQQPAAQAPGERSNVQITTPGAFIYNVGQEADLARFEMKPGDQQSPVQVVRPLVKDGVTFYDRLDCEVLEMQFAHPPQKPDGPQTNIAVKQDAESSLRWAHAWGKYIVLTSQAENLQAHGNDLFHDANTKLTTLKGTPEVTAIKEGHEIHAPQIVLSAPDAAGGQGATAEGEGYFRGQMTGEEGGEGGHTVIARWRDRMHYRKEGGLEQIHLAGAAGFEDLERKQSISGDQIKLTLAPEAVPSDRPAALGPGRSKPRRLEVTGSVTAKSPELKVHDTDVLVLLFQNAPVAKPSPEAPGVSVSTGGAPAPPGVIPLQTATQPKAQPAPPKPPLDLSATTIQANLLTRQSGPTELDDVHCEGHVRVHQDGANPQEKPVDMRGDALELVHKSDGHKLTLKGETERPAEMILPDIALLGPLIELDQVENRANVFGPGAMRILSTTDFQGNKLQKPTDLQVSWKEKMDFDGTLAEFYGHVQADQENTRLLCHHMQVTLDQRVRLGQQDPQANQNPSRAANVDKVICVTTGEDGAQPVSVEDSIREKDQLVRYQRIESRELAVFKKTGQLEAAGPGEVRILQPGPKNGGLSPLPDRGPALKTPPPPAEEEMKLTYVRYGSKLAVENEKRTAKFWRGVEVLHLPADDPGLRLNLNRLIDHLPKGALYMKCDVLEVYTEEANGKKTHIMIAKEKAKVQFDDVNGDADIIKYNEASQQVIFEGTRSRPAVLTKQVARGQKPQIFKADKITYNRSTGQFDGTNVISISE